MPFSHHKSLTQSWVLFHLLHLLIMQVSVSELKESRTYLLLLGVLTACQTESAELVNSEALQESCKGVGTKVISGNIQDCAFHTCT